MGKKIKWLDRRIGAPGPYMALCLSQEDFDKAVKHLRTVGKAAPFVNAGSSATTHFFTLSGTEELTAVIGLTDTDGRSGVQIAAMLVHEAVHVWQRYAETIGEHEPGIEQEAYAVQSIAQELMQEYVRQKIGESRNG